MNDLKRNIVFFHGLNTFGDDLLHLGPVTFGRMDSHLKVELEKRGRNFVSIDGIGAGPLEAQADIAIEQMATAESLVEGSSIHLLGQSMGGLVARVVARRLKTDPLVNRKNLVVGNIVTMGTPHRGTIAANLAVDFATNIGRVVGKHQILERVFDKMGYRLDRKSETFRNTTPQSMDVFNLKYPIDAEIPEHSLICAVPLYSVSKIFWGLYRKLHGLDRLEMIRGALSKEDNFAPSDGLIPVGSQNWGQGHGPYRLDHFAQMGLFSSRSRLEKQAERDEFQRLCDDIAKLTMGPLGGSTP